MEKSKAIEKIERQLKALEYLNVRSASASEFKKWLRDTELAIEYVFGSDTRHLTDFRSVRFNPRRYNITNPTLAFSEALHNGLRHVQALLMSMIEEIQEYWGDKETHKDAVPSSRNADTLRVLRSKEVWSAIEDDFDLSKRAFARKIAFVQNEFRRRIILRDIEQAYVLAENGFCKPAVILAGSVIEELLRQFLIYKEITPSSDTFDAYIKTCQNNRLLKDAIHRLSDSVRHFRNLVHLSKEISARHTISKATAKGAVASIFTIANDFG
jgi:hypothetical protein